MPLVIVKVILLEYIKIQCSKYELEKSEVCENREEEVFLYTTCYSKGRR